MISHEIDAMMDAVLREKPPGLPDDHHPGGWWERHHAEVARLSALMRCPADRRIIAWMPVEYMEAARAGQGSFDALDTVIADGYLKVGDAVSVKDLGPTLLELFPCTCADCADAPEAKPEPECGVWLISPSSLPGCMRNGAQDGKGKAKGRAMVYDFEEVP